MDLFGFDVLVIIAAVFVAYYLSESLWGFAIVFLIAGSCFGGFTRTETGQKALDSAKVVIEEVIDSPVGTPNVDPVTVPPTITTPSTEEEEDFDFGGGSDFGATDFGAP